MKAARRPPTGRLIMLASNRHRSRSPRATRRLARGAERFGLELVDRMPADLDGDADRVPVAGLIVPLYIGEKMFHSAPVVCQCGFKNRQTRRDFFSAALPTLVDIGGGPPEFGVNSIDSHTALSNLASHIMGSRAGTSRNEMSLRPNRDLGGRLGVGGQRPRRFTVSRTRHFGISTARGRYRVVEFASQPRTSTSTGAAG
jgi:hypothetical protein